MSYVANIGSMSNENENFRKVVYTDAKLQLVLMKLNPNEDIGEETHQHVEQVLAITSNSGMSVLDGVERPIKAGDIVIVPPGTKHNIVNGPGEAMKIITTYVPPNHIDGTVHKTKADAIADTKDEAFGESVA
jgi:mannose-6-phosphate isomerase-like protein (cupin superfamily)